MPVSCALWFLFLAHMSLWIAEVTWGWLEEPQSAEEAGVVHSCVSDMKRLLLSEYMKMLIAWLLSFLSDFNIYWATKHVFGLETILIAIFFLGRCDSARQLVFYRGHQCQPSYFCCDWYPLSSVESKRASALSPLLPTCSEDVQYIAWELVKLHMVWPDYVCTSVYICCSEWKINKNQATPNKLNRALLMCSCWKPLKLKIDFGFCIMPSGFFIQCLQHLVMKIVYAVRAGISVRATNVKLLSGSLTKIYPRLTSSRQLQVSELVRISL